ncbi:MAG: ATPase [Sarcina sp.]
MAIEVISEIKKAEEAAKDLIKEAQSEVRDLIAKATINSENEYKKIVDEAKNKGENKIKEKIELANKETNDLFVAGKEDCAKIQSVSSEKIDEAVKLVIERIVNIHGNS